MEALYPYLPMLVPLALFGVFLASLPTGIDILRRGNDADPLRRDMEAKANEELEKQAELDRAA